jgi:hypothetical protein
VRGLERKVRARMPWRSPMDRVLAVEGMLSEAEIKALMSHAAEVRSSDCIVEVGSYRGRSATALALGARRGDGAPIFAIEPHESFTGVLGGEFGPPDRVAFFRNLLRAGVVEQVRLVNLSSEAVSPGWNRPVGLLWLDGDHSLEGVWRDFDAWFDHLAKDAVVAFHDAADPKLGPAKVIDTLLSRGDFSRAADVDQMVVLRRKAG